MVVPDQLLAAVPFTFNKKQKAEMLKTETRMMEVDSLSSVKQAGRV